MRLSLRTYPRVTSVCRKRRAAARVSPVLRATSDSVSSRSSASKASMTASPRSSDWTKSALWLAVAAARSVLTAGLWIRCRLALVITKAGEHLLGDCEGGVGGGHAGVDGSVQEHLADLLAGKTVVQGAPHMDR